MSTLLRLGIALLITMSIRCHRDRDREEMRGVLSRIDRMRDTPAQQRAHALGELERETTTLPLTRDARHHCLTAYRALERGHALSATVQRAITTAAQTTAHPAASAHQHLADADQALQAASKAMEQCVRSVAALRRQAR